MREDRATYGWKHLYWFISQGVKIYYFNNIQNLKKYDKIMNEYAK